MEEDQEWTWKGMYIAKPMKDNVDWTKKLTDTKKKKKKKKKMNGVKSRTRKCLGNPLEEESVRPPSLGRERICDVGEEERLW